MVLRNLLILLSASAEAFVALATVCRLFPADVEALSLFFIRYLERQMSLRGKFRLFRGHWKQEYLAAAKDRI